MKSTWKKLLLVRRHPLLRFLAGYFMCIRNQFSRLMMGEILRFIQFLICMCDVCDREHAGVHVVALSKMRSMLYFADQVIILPNYLDM